MPPRPREVDPVVLRTMQEAPKHGVPVRYWSVWNAAHQDSFVDTETTSAPWQLGHGEWVVKLEGRTSGQAVSHCVLLDADMLKKGPAHAN